MARLYTSHTTEIIDLDKISDTDRAIRAYIDKHVDDDPFDDDISEEDDWQIFYHLSELRTGIVSWYDFKPGAEVLEVGAGFGAITKTLCRICGHVTSVESSLYRALAMEQRFKATNNLDIYAGDIEEIKLDRKYDYIVLIGVLETVGNGSSDLLVYTNFIKRLCHYLKPDGVILLATENRYGLRYFCGATEPHTNRPFDGINHYPHGTSGYSFSKQELIDILKQSDLYNKFYFPLPDYRLPQLVYTMEYLPDKSLKERLIPYYRRNDTMVAMESELYDDLVDNQVFPFFANSFFVECSLQESFCNVIYAAISTDRGLEGSYATTIRNNGIVRKQPLYPEGEKSALKLYQNIQQLIVHHIPVVEHIWNDGIIEMPYIGYPTLSNYIKTIITNDGKMLIEILDQIYAYILASSEEVPAQKNALLKRIQQVDTKASKLDWGPILKNAYLELIPLNCFYNEGEFLFFDQEYVRENYPAKYVLFRAIHYIYGFTPNAESILPIQSLKEKYSMVDTWDHFILEEQRFLNEVRQQDRYRVFYHWAKFDWNRMIYNMSALESEEEKIAKVQVPEHRKQVWKRQLELLDVIDSLCKNNGIRYFLIHGTLLGAKRHKGFIPWDDDIDIALLRDDYEKLKELSENKLSDPYFLQTPENDAECFYGGYMKLRNTNTTAMELINWGHNCNQGIWIDIFPLDACYNDLEMNNNKLRKVAHYQRLLYAQVYSEKRSFRDTTDAVWNLYRLLAKLYTRKKLYNYLKKELVKGDVNSDKIGIFTHYNGGKGLLQFDRIDFAGSCNLQFEYRSLPAPVGYENCLKTSFGEQYMKFPCPEYRIPHHKAFYASKVSYKDYMKRFMNTFDAIDKKTVVLFGAGHMFEDYMQKYGKVYPPQFLVDNNPNKWGTDKQGIPILKPEELLKVDRNRLHLIICNIYYRNIEEQLKTMGITDYYIYVQEKEWLTSDPL
jgi:phosphorylcholine metabolism protein LicD/2-polyprenyl-3-methyl-5-hydroxy-6-metoxy-1,4-benzoquinol methylase